MRGDITNDRTKENFYERVEYTSGTHFAETGLGETAGASLLGDLAGASLLGDLPNQTMRRLDIQKLDYQHQLVQSM